jgi:hypothetical protein
VEWCCVVLCCVVLFCVLLCRVKLYRVVLRCAVEGIAGRNCKGSAVVPFELCCRGLRLLFQQGFLPFCCCFGLLRHQPFTNSLADPICLPCTCNPCATIKPRDPCTLRPSEDRFSFRDAQIPYHGELSSCTSLGSFKICPTGITFLHIPAPACSKHVGLLVCAPTYIEMVALTPEELAFVLTAVHFLLRSIRCRKVHVTLNPEVLNESLSHDVNI